MITVKSGSATSPRPSKGKGVIIGSIVNNLGGYGKGFVKAIDELSLMPQVAYRALAKQHNNNIPMGSINFIEVQLGLFVSNMVAQNGYARNSQDGCALDYDALKKCLLVTFHRALRLGYGVHMPEKIGAGLAGGNQERIHTIIQECMNEAESSVWARHNNAKLDITLWRYGENGQAAKPAMQAMPENLVVPVAKIDELVKVVAPNSDEVVVLADDELANWG